MNFPGRQEAFKLLKKYNKEDFHILHAATVGSVMKNLAIKKGYENEADFWFTAGLLHDLDFEMWPEKHCTKVCELLNEAGNYPELEHSICSHGYGMCVDIEPKHEMEKLLYACDELTGIVGAAVILRPSHSCRDMDLKSLKKKFKDKRFAAGCDREVISKGAEMLGIELPDLMELTLKAMQDEEDNIKALVEEIQAA